MARRRHRVRSHVKRRRGRIIKVVGYQRGSSKKRYNKRYKAMKPGKRRSRTGRIYWETRKNRSDGGKTL